MELWGYEGIEKVGEAVSKRGEIGTEVAEEERKASVPVEPTYNSKSGTKRAPTTTTGGRRDHTPSSQITFRTPEELAEQKRFRKAARHKGKFREEEEDMELDLEDLERIREEALRRGPGPLVSGKRVSLLSLLFRGWWGTDFVATESGWECGTVSSCLSFDGEFYEWKS